MTYEQYEKARELVKRVDKLRGQIQALDSMRLRSDGVVHLTIGNAPDYFQADFSADTANALVKFARERTVAAMQECENALGKL